jgi:AMMECR1 domain-containing protein
MPVDKPLSQEERRFLLQLARQTIEKAVNAAPLPEIDLSSLTPALQAPGASFVTLTQNGHLRGCIGQDTGFGYYAKIA